MASVNEVFKLVQRWERSGNIWYNVYHYQVLTVNNGAVAGAQNLIDAFIQDVQTNTRSLVSQFAQVQGYTAQSLTAPADWYEFDYNTGTASGAVASEALPDQWVITLKCYRPYPPLVNGYKRYGGIAEACVEGDAVATGYQTALTNLENALGADISYTGADYVFRPVIVPGQYADGSTPAPWRANRWQFARMGTQRSRMPA